MQGRARGENNSPAGSTIPRTAASWPVLLHTTKKLRSPAVQPRFYTDATAGVRSNILDFTTLSRIVELTWIILVQIANGLPFHVCRARRPGACALTAGHGSAATRPVHRTGRPAPRPRTIHATIPITDSSVSDEIDVRVAGPARQIAVEKITPTGSCPFLGRYAFHGVGPKEKLRVLHCSRHIHGRSCRVRSNISTLPRAGSVSCKHQGNPQ